MPNHGKTYLSQLLDAMNTRHVVYLLAVETHFHAQTAESKRALEAAIVGRRIAADRVLAEQSITA